MTLFGILRRLKMALRRDNYVLSYSQCGEDRIVAYLLTSMGITRPTYLDLGANHPTNLSNTYLFYSEGSRGVCIEPNPVLHAAFQKKRPNDICLNVGVGSSEEERLDFYIFEDAGLSTFSKKLMNDQIASGYKHVETRPVDLKSINILLDQYFEGGVDFVSLDTEGFDLKILESWNFKKYRPLVFCVETLTFLDQRKMSEIIDYMHSCGYLTYADTNLNTIFVDKAIWSAHLERLTTTASINS